MDNLLSRQGLKSMPEEWKDPDDYHNEAIDAYRQAFENNSRRAFGVIVEGLQLYPYDVDLLSDAIHWGPVGVKEEWLLGSLADLFCALNNDAADDEISSAFENELKKVGHRDAEGIDSYIATFADDYLAILCTRMKLWNWRAYNFAIDYLVDKRVPVLKSRDDVNKTLEMAKRLANRFSKSRMDIDRSVSAQAKVLLAERNYDAAKILLDEEIRKSNSPMPSCCIRLIDLLMDAGEYEQAIDIADKGIIATAQTQPGASVGYFVYCKAIAHEALYLINGGTEPYTRDKVERLYKSAYQIAPPGTYKENIDTRAKRLGINLDSKEERTVTKEERTVTSGEVPPAELLRVFAQEASRQNNVNSRV